MRSLSAAFVLVFWSLSALAQSPEVVERIGKMGHVPMTLTEPMPPEVGEASAWHMVDTNQVGIALEAIHTSTVHQLPVAVIIAAEGVCPDTDVLCVAAIRWELSIARDEASKTTRTLARYALLSEDGKRWEGLSMAVVADGADALVSAQYWTLKAGAWELRTDASVDAAFLGWLIPVAHDMAKRRNAVPKPPKHSRPTAPAIRA